MIEQLTHLAATRPDAPFVLHGEEAYDFATAADIAARGAAWLEQHGIRRGDHVLLAVTNRPLFLFYWLSLAQRGAVAVPVSHDAFGDPLRYMAEQSDARLLLTEDSEASRLRADLGGLLPLLSFADEAAFMAAVAPFAPRAAEAVPPDWPLSILYTSGTTGQPKGVLVPRAAYAAVGRKIVEAIGITPEDRILTFLPLHHANPQMYSVMSALTAGCCVALAPRFSASRFLDQVRHYRATGFTYVGTVLSILAKEIAAPVETSLRFCVGGGAPRAVWEELEPRLGVAVHELYGMTETGGVVTINTREKHRFATVGTSRDDFDVVVLDERDQTLPTGSIGEIAVRPRQPYVMTTGYYGKPEETLDASSNFWFHTGDLGRFDADGFLHFEGRKKELIRRGGEMISPVSIELCALKHEAIADCAAVGVPDDILEEDIKLVVVRRSPVEPAEIVGFLARQLPRHMLPRYVQFADEIPKTPTQKVQRFKLVRLDAPVHDTHDIRRPHVTT